MITRILHLLALVAALALGSCVDTPPRLATSPEQGATMPYIVNHINCELSSILDARPGGIATPANLRIYQQAYQEPEIFDLLDKMVTYHFVASVLLTIDTTDMEGISPSFTFIHPLTATFSRAIGINPQLDGSQASD